MKKTAIFYTIFLAVQSGAVLASRRCESAKIPIARGLTRKRKNRGGDAPECVPLKTVVSRNS